MLELAWNFQVNGLPNIPLPPLGHPDNRSDLQGLPQDFTDLFPTAFLNNQGASPPIQLAGTVRWDHLIYAYMIENTRIYEVFRRVVHEYLHGEQLGVPSRDSLFWLRNTEELFYTDQPPYYITHLTSQIRPDLIATRRNAYYRMFGIDLIHGKGDGQTYPYEKARVSNTDFVAIFEEFLREVWVGYANLKNTGGEKFTDDSAILNLAIRLHDMLRARRQNGNLSREEFPIVSMLGWFHLTVEFNSPIVLDLRADASSPEQRLVKIAERVGLKVPAMAKSFFDIADPISRLLIFLETDVLPTLGLPAIPGLYEDGSPIRDDILNIINHWSLTTGRDLKTRRVAPNIRTPVPA